MPNLTEWMKRHFYPVCLVVWTFQYFSVHNGLNNVSVVHILKTMFWLYRLFLKSIAIFEFCEIKEVYTVSNNSFSISFKSICGISINHLMLLYVSYRLWHCLMIFSPFVCSHKESCEYLYNHGKENCGWGQTGGGVSLSILDTSADAWDSCKWVHCYCTVTW